MGGVLFFAVSDALLDFQPYKEQRSIINQTTLMIQNGMREPLLIRDWTGALGDKYTFMFSDTLRSALAVSGTPADVNICTPNGVDVNHPDIRAP